jgi:hypothetical protein
MWGEDLERPSRIERLILHLEAIHERVVTRAPLGLYSAPNGSLNVMSISCLIVERCRPIIIISLSHTIVFGMSK